MPYRKFANNKFYHLYNHAIDNKILFQNSSDYKRFLFCLKELNDEKNVSLYERQLYLKNDWEIKRGNPLVDILSYTLIPTHFHISFKARGAREASLFLQKIGIAYTYYFNKKYNRKGPLFCGKMKTVHIDNEAYFQYITYYTHLNILDLINKKWREGKMNLSPKEQKFLFTYPWSSIGFYVSRAPNEIINTELAEEFFPSVQEYEKELIKWVRSNLHARSGLTGFSPL